MRCGAVRLTWLLACLGLAGAGCCTHPAGACVNACASGGCGVGSAEGVGSVGSMAPEPLAPSPPPPVISRFHPVPTRPVFAPR